MAAVTMQLCAAPTGVASSSSRAASSRSIAPLRCFTAAVRGQAVYQKAELRAAARQSVVARAAFAGEPCGWNVHDCAGRMAGCLVAGRRKRRRLAAARRWEARGLSTATRGPCVAQTAADDEEQQYGQDDRFQERVVQVSVPARRASSTSAGEQGCGGANGSGGGSVTPLSLPVLCLLCRSAA